MIQKEYTSQRLRIRFFTMVFLFLFGIITVRLFETQVSKSAYYRGLADNQHWVTRKIPAERGQIYARDLKTGEKYLLATNKKMSMVYAVPRQIKDKKKTAKELSSILTMPEDEVSKLIDNDKLYVPIKHKLTEEEVGKIEDTTSVGVMLSSEYWRDYPEGSLASHVIGFVNNDGVGQYGIEGYYDQELKGVPGEVSLEKDSVGRPITVGEKLENPAQDGDDVVLTIDRTIQSFAEKELKDAIEKFEAPSGSVIVMNPNNGEVWAMANYPDFDPNNYSEAEDFNIFKNASISHVYEPGSIFKVLTMASGIDSGKVRPSTTYTDSGAISIGGYTIRNSDGKANGVQTMTQVLEKSLNTGSYFVKEQMGNEAYYKYLEKFGFGKKTGIDLIGETSSTLPAFSSLKDINFATITFGQGIAVTPIQFICAASSIANGGEMVKPRMVAEFVKEDASKQETQKETVGRVLRKESADMTGAMMVSVVENGHGKQAKVPGFRTAGKTGTAEIPSPDGNGYMSGKNIGSFILFVPAENPQFIILVKIDEPKGVQWAESTAAPVAGKLAKKILDYLEVAPSE